VGYGGLAVIVSWPLFVSLHERAQPDANFGGAIMPSSKLLKLLCSSACCCTQVSRDVAEAEALLGQWGSNNYNNSNNASPGCPADVRRATRYRGKRKKRKVWISGKRFGYTCSENEFSRAPAACTCGRTMIARA
jgi:hypothetical protein